jgi:hypothetical protein
MRSLSPSFVIAPPTGAKVRSRLHLDATDEAVLLQLGRGPDRRADRKRTLTTASSSRWAGAITRTANDQWTRGYQNLQAEYASLRRAIGRLQQRVQAPVGGKAGRIRGYPTKAERWAKQRRLQALSARLARVEARLVVGRVSVVRGGRRLARTRHHLEAAGLIEPQWRQRWVAERLFLTADGEADKAWGNETIRWHPVEGWLELKLPGPLAHLANRPHGRYRLSCLVGFSYRGEEVAAQAASGAVRYDITLDPDRRRWYLHASWKVQPHPIPTVEEAVANGVVAVDLNADHLACWTIDRHGNPVGRPVTVLLDQDGLPQATRDGRLRAAISQVCALARSRGMGAVAIEDLGFADARAAGRESLGRGRRGKRLRRIIAEIPTGRFRDRLGQMAHNQGLWVVAEDPAYTSVWGGRYWQAPLQQRHPSLGLGPGGGRASSTVTGGSPLRATATQADPSPGACTAQDHPDPRSRTAQAGQTGRGNRHRPLAQAAHDRSGSPISASRRTLMHQERLQ